MSDLMCPTCKAVAYPELDVCEKCGRPFGALNQQDSNGHNCTCQHCGHNCWYQACGKCETRLPLDMWN